jgi:carboxyvinyl-carboxyphosphonate phosphorylmutase
VTDWAQLAALQAAADGVPLMLGGTPPALADKAKLAAHGVRIALQGHAPSFAAMAAVHATLKALRDGTPPGKLPGLADAGLSKAALREDDYARWTREFLAG